MRQFSIFAKFSFLMSIFSLFSQTTFAQSAEIRPNQGVSVPQFTTAFITAMTTQPKGTVVFDKDLNLMKYWDGATWQTMSGGVSGGSSNWTVSGTNISNSNTGNVGIGFTNPSSKLTINGSNSISPIVSNSATNGALTIYSPTSGLLIGNNYLNFDNNSIQSRFAQITFPTNLSESNLKLNPYGGKIGIGTGTDPINATLLVKKSLASNDGTAMFKGTAYNSHFHFGANEDTYINGGKLNSNVYISNGTSGNVGIGPTPGSITSTLLVYKSPNSLDGTAVFKGTTHFSHFSYGTNEDTYIRGGKDQSKVVLNDGPLGYVGVGTIPMKAKLEVNSDNGVITNAIFGSNGNGISIQKNYPGIGFNSYRDASNVQRSMNSGFGFVNALDPGNGVLFWNKLGNSTGPDQNLGSAETFAMGLTQEGNLGLGVYPSTLYRLSVNGTVRTKEVIVETGWADYVFDKNYKLKSISEMEDFILKNKHLPNIPAAAEIESNGLKVGEVNKAMMEKIEELTLYIIQLNKKIEILEFKKL